MSSTEFRQYLRYKVFSPSLDKQSNLIATAFSTKTTAIKSARSGYSKLVQIENSEEMLAKVCLLVLAAATLLSVSNAYSIPNLSEGELSTRVFNGKNATQGQFPFYVLIQIQLSIGKRAVCGGNLIHPRFVLTAAHCVENAKEFRLHFCALDSANESEPGRVIKVSQNGTTHPSWVLPIVWNDIALIDLGEPVDTTECIQTIKLPKSNQVFEDGKNVTVVGFGLTDPSRPVIASRLQYAPLRIVAHRVCVKRFPIIVFRKSVVCAVGDKQESACQGDSGGPLIDPETKTLVGLTSFGSPQGCNIGAPAVYTRIASYIPWIEKTIAQRLAAQ